MNRESARAVHEVDIGARCAVRGRGLEHHLGIAPAAQPKLQPQT